MMTSRTVFSSGAEFTRHAEVTFHPGNQRLNIVQTARGLDEQNYLQVDTHLHGDLPFIPPGATVQMDPFKETFQYYPSGRTHTEHTTPQVEHKQNTVPLR